MVLYVQLQLWLSLQTSGSGGGTQQVQLVMPLTTLEQLLQDAGAKVTLRGGALVLSEQLHCNLVDPPTVTFLH
jgi:hypothetical protein